MAQKILTTTPDKPISGNSLMKESVAGRKTQFVLQSTSVSLSFTVNANSTRWVAIAAQFWATDLPVTSRSANNIIGPDKTILFPQVDAYIDNDNNGAYYIGSGGSLSSGQLGVILSMFPARTPTIYSGSVHNSGYVLFSFHNTDSSSHVVYMYANTKYIVFADVNL